MPVKPAEIATLIDLFNTSGWDELHVEIDGLQLFLSTDPKARLTSGPGQAQAPAAVAPAVPLAAPAAAPVPVPAQGTVQTNWVPVTAPNLGTFYLAPKPGAANFVEIGQRVSPTTEICLIEVMKLFTTLQAGLAGTIRQICVNDAEMVEHGQILFYIEP